MGKIIDRLTADNLHQIREIRNMAYHLDHPAWAQCNSFQDELSFVYALHGHVADLPDWRGKPQFLDSIGFRHIVHSRFQQLSWCRMAKDACLKELDVTTGRIEDAPVPQDLQDALHTLLSVGGNVAHGKLFNRKASQQVSDAMKTLRPIWKAIPNNNFDFYRQLICPECKFDSAEF